jgi:hypothetical protein
MTNDIVILSPQLTALPDQCGDARPATSDQQMVIIAPDFIYCMTSEYWRPLHVVLLRSNSRYLHM